jgi:hypothetical protein
MFGQTVATHDKASESKYVVSDRQSLLLRANGVAGELQLLIDSRLTPKLLNEAWGTGDVDGDDPDFAIKTEGPRNAVVRIVGIDDSVIESQALERPLAKLEKAKLYGDSKLTYLVTVDYSAGFGSYSGPVTLPLEVEEGHLKWLQAVKKGTNQREQIRLMNSLKTVWKFSDPKSGQRREIFRAACRPDFKSGDTEPKFTITYTHYSFNGVEWVYSERVVPGFEEFEDGFPKRSLFP